MFEKGQDANLAQHFLRPDVSRLTLYYLPWIDTVREPVKMSTTIRSYVIHARKLRGGRKNNAWYEQAIING